MAIAMPSFSTRRGRPPSHKPATDYGTPELIARRARGETSEAIDLCLERRLISPAEHWCGIHLRWLHTLRHGAPGVSALALTDGSKTILHEADEVWQREREEEYRIAMELLKQRQASMIVADICIYNCMASFLKPRHRRDIQSNTEKELALFKYGLEALTELWIS